MQRTMQLSGGRRSLVTLGTVLVAGLLAACDSTTPTPTSPTVRQAKVNADITLPGCNFDTCTSPPRILFTNLKDGNAEIYSMNADGTSPKRLTFNANVDNFASWSPDYTKIVFASTRINGVFNIFTMNADGSNVQQLTNSGVANTGPRWSPDGTKIAFHRTWDKRRYTIQIMNADGSNLHSLRDLPNVDDGQPAWSPDGTRIAFKSNAADPAYGGYDIWTVRAADGGDPVRLTTTLRAGEPAYSPTGTKIAFTQGSFASLPRGIYLTSAFGSGTPTLITTSAGYDVSPTFRPDGKRIAYASTRMWGGMTPAKWSILTVNLDGKFLSMPSASIFIDNMSPSWGVH